MKKSIEITITCLFLLVGLTIIDYFNVYPNLEIRILSLRFGENLNKTRSKYGVLRIDSSDLEEYSSLSELYYRKYRHLDDAKFQKNKTIYTISNQRLTIDSIIKHSNSYKQYSKIQVDTCFFTGPQNAFSPLYMQKNIVLNPHRLLLLTSFCEEYESVIFPLSDSLAIGNHLYEICHTLRRSYYLNKDTLLLNQCEISSPTRLWNESIFHLYTTSMINIRTLSRQECDSILNVWKYEQLLNLD